MNYTKRDSVKNYFPLPNEIFSFGLKAGEIAIYAYLMSIENRKTFQCYPSFKTIGSAVGMSVNTVQKYVKSLEDKNFISTESTSIFRKTGEKVNGNLLYTIKPIAETLKTFYEKQMIEFERQNAIYRFEKKNGREYIIAGESKVLSLPLAITSDGSADRKSQ